MIKIFKKWWSDTGQMSKRNINNPVAASYEAFNFGCEQQNKKLLDALRYIATRDYQAAPDVELRRDRDIANNALIEATGVYNGWRLT